MEKEWCDIVNCADAQAGHHKKTCSGVFRFGHISGGVQ